MIKKAVKVVDLSLLAQKARVSPRTGFLHFNPQDPSAWDTIPVYENFCYAFALFRQKTQDSVLAGKDLIEKLMQFQTIDGNFPSFIHEYPKAWDPHLPLKIAPIFVHILRDFGGVLQTAFKQSLENALKLMIRPPKSPSWEHRYRALLGERPTGFENLDAENWLQWIISDQLFEKNGSYPIPYNRLLQQFLGPNLSFEQFFPQPSTIEYILAEADGYCSRLFQDHFRQIYACLLFPFSSSLELFEEVSICKDPYRIFWDKNLLHSLESTPSKVGIDSLEFDLEGSLETTYDLFEVEFFLSRLPDVNILINDQKSIVFRLGDKVQIFTNTRKIELEFLLDSGIGDFLGHISFGNRKSQLATKNSQHFYAYDWHIGLRTLRREIPCKIVVKIKIEPIESTQ